GQENNSFPLESLATPSHKPPPPQYTGVPSSSFQRFDARPVPISPDRRKDKLLLFHHALQGVLVLAREIHHLRHFGLGDLVGEHAALPDSVMMDVEHDL